MMIDRKLNVTCPQCACNHDIRFPQEFLTLPISEEQKKKYKEVQEILNKINVETNYHVFF